MFKIYDPYLHLEKPNSNCNWKQENPKHYLSSQIGLKSLPTKNNFTAQLTDPFFITPGRNIFNRKKISLLALFFCTIDASMRLFYIFLSFASEYMKIIQVFTSPVYCYNSSSSFTYKLGLAYWIIEEWEAGILDFSY